jgi:hypothetical protein
VGDRTPEATAEGVDEDEWMDPFDASSCETNSLFEANRDYCVSPVSNLTPPFFSNFIREDANNGATSAMDHPLDLENEAGEPTQIVRNGDSTTPSKTKRFFNSYKRLGRFRPSSKPRAPLTSIDLSVNEIIMEQKAGSARTDALTTATSRITDKENYHPMFAYIVPTDSTTTDNVELEDRSIIVKLQTFAAEIEEGGGMV